jgi:hypothetical protein
VSWFKILPKNFAYTKISVFFFNMLYQHIFVKALFYASSFCLKKSMWGKDGITAIYAKKAC